MLKLNTLLAKTDHLSSIFRAMISEYTHFFGKTNNFTGEKKTYEPVPGTADDPSSRGNRLIITTVDEKLLWFEENAEEYINALFAQEATNASGRAKAPLIVEGEEWGVFTSLELLRLKSLLEANQLEQMYQAIPVRSDAEEWKPTTQEMYKDKYLVFEGPLNAGEKKSILKESYILEDPNLDRLKSTESYRPVVVSKDTVIKLGDYTWQKFSGEWSARDKATLLQRRSRLLNAIIEALKVANDVEVVKSDITAEKIFNYLHGE